MIASVRHIYIMRVLSRLLAVSAAGVGWLGSATRATAGPSCAENLLVLQVSDLEPCYREGDQLCVELAMSELKQQSIALWILLMLLILVPWALE